LPERVEQLHVRLPHVLPEQVDAQVGCVQVLHVTEHVELPRQVLPERVEHLHVRLLHVLPVQVDAQVLPEIVVRLREQQQVKTQVGVDTVQWEPPAQVFAHVDVPWQVALQFGPEQVDPQVAMQVLLRQVVPLSVEQPEDVRTGSAATSVGFWGERAVSTREA